MGKLVVLLTLTGVARAVLPPGRKADVAGSVIPKLDRSGPNLAWRLILKHFVTRELFAYWNRLRGARVAPERGDIDPASIRAILADTFILEVTGGVSERDFPIRLSGTRLNALVLRELKGTSFLSLFAGEERTAMADLLDVVLDDQAAVVAGLRAHPAGGASIDLELLLLPLRHHAKTHSRLIGALSPPHIPSWLGLLPIENLSLLSFRNVSRPLASPFMTGPDPATGAAAEPRHHGRFKVYQGGR